MPEHLLKPLSDPVPVACLLDHQGEHREIDIGANHALNS